MTNDQFAGCWLVSTWLVTGWWWVIWTSPRCSPVMAGCTGARRPMLWGVSPPAPGSTSTARFHQRICILWEWTTPPPPPVVLPLPALSAVQYTALPVRLYNCRQSRRGKVGWVVSIEDDGGQLSVLRGIYSFGYTHRVITPRWPKPVRLSL